VRTDLNEQGLPNFFSGDVRVMENVVLSTWHTMFARLHDIVVDELSEIDPEMDTETLFEEARLFVIAMIQQITFEEQVPAIMGETLIGKTPQLQMSDKLVPLNPNRGNPVVFNEWTTAAFRFVSIKLIYL
jgi:peroxidase